MLTSRVPPSPKTLLIALPAMTVAFVAFALALGPRGAVPAARVYGGPTEGARTLSIRIVALESAHGSERLLLGRSLRVSAELGGGVVTSASRATGPDGVADFNLNLPFALGTTPIVLTVSSFDADGPHTLVRSEVRLDAKTWSRFHRRRGGVSEQTRGDISTTIAPRRGVLAVPFNQELDILVSKSGSPVAGLRLLPAGEGLSFPSDGPVQTDSSGYASLLVRPLFHQVAFTLEAVNPDRTLVARYHSTLPVVPGALFVDVEKQGSTLALKLRSPVPRDRAYFSLVTEEHRLFGGSVKLAEQADGQSVGEATVPLPSSEHFWVVSSDVFDQSSLSTVGWPVHLAEGPQLGSASRTTLDAPDLLLADGLPAALNQSARRMRRTRYVAAFIALLGLSTSTFLATLVYRRSRSNLLEEELARLSQAEGTTDPAPIPASVTGPKSVASGTLWAVLSVFVIGLGFALLAIFALLG